jgi:hypothetical protein
VVVGPGEIIVVTIVSIVLSIVVLAALWPWARDPRRLVALL